MTERTRCETCNKELKNSDGLAAHNNAKHPELVPKEIKPINKKKIKNWSIFIIIVGLIIVGIVWGISNVKTLPPITMQGHVETKPVSHVIREPMGDAVQRHMLEHIDGTGRPGVIINYNCKDYLCEENLIETLESFASDYDYVYVVPFKGMDAKIAITKLGKIDVLDEYNKIRIKNFIEER